MLDLSAIAERPVFVLAGALGLIAIKALVIGGLGMLLGMGWRASLALGLLLSQGGEFGFVLFAQAQAGLLIDPEAASLFSAIVTLSMAATPFLMMVTAPLRRAPQSKEGREGPRKDGAAALVVGYGRFGQTVAQMMIANDIAVTLIDTDTEMIRSAADFGFKVYYGDGTRLDVLQASGAGSSKAIVVCVDKRDTATHIARLVQAEFPLAKLLVRSYDREHALSLVQMGVTAHVRETFESALALGRAAVMSLGATDLEAQEIADQVRGRDRERLDKQIADGINAGRDLLLGNAPLPGQVRPQR